MSQETTPKSLFTPVPEPSERSSLLQEAITTRAKITLWTKNKTLVQGNLTLLSANPELGLVLAARSEAVTREVEQKIKEAQEMVYLNCGLATGNIFITTTASANPAPAGKPAFCLTYPTDFFKVQRRTAFRLVLRPPYSLYAEFKILGDLEVSRLKITDISTGGLAFLASEVEKEKFTVGTLISPLKFAIRSRHISAPVEVRHTRVSNSEAGSALVVGVQFTSISSKDKSFLDRFISEEMRTQFTALMP